MEKIILGIALALIATPTFAQGTVNFDNLGVNAPFFDNDGTGPGTKANAGAGLYIGDTLVPGSVTSFFGNTDPAAQYVSAIVVAIPGVAPGTAVTLRVGIWTGGTSYETATLSHGFTPPFTVITGGAGDPPSLPADLVGLASYTIPIVPEPSTIAIGLLGAGALLLRRRK